MMRPIQAFLLVFLFALGTGATFAHDEPGERPRLATGTRFASSNFNLPAQ